jgi:hypothetical protein
MDISKSTFFRFYFPRAFLRTPRPSQLPRNLCHIHNAGRKDDRSHFSPFRRFVLSCHRHHSDWTAIVQEEGYKQAASPSKYPRDAHLTFVQASTGARGNHHLLLHLRHRHPPRVLHDLPLVVHRCRTSSSSFPHDMPLIFRGAGAIGGPSQFKSHTSLGCFRSSSGSVSANHTPNLLASGLESAPSVASPHLRTSRSSG